MCVRTSMIFSGNRNSINNSVILSRSILTRLNRSTLIRILFNIFLWKTMIRINRSRLSREQIFRRLTSSWVSSWLSWPSWSSSLWCETVKFFFQKSICRLIKTFFLIRLNFKDGNSWKCFVISILLITITFRWIINSSKSTQINICNEKSMEIQSIMTVFLWKIKWFMFFNVNVFNIIPNIFSE